MEKLAQINIGETFNSPWGRPQGFGDLVSIILSNALILAGLILLFLLIGGGLMMIIGAGQSDPQSSAKGKQAATAAFVGFIIIFAAYWIIRFVESITGLHILEPVGL